jgi:hypothetical protein
VTMRRFRVMLSCRRPPRWERDHPAYHQDRIERFVRKPYGFGIADDALLQVEVTGRTVRITSVFTSSDAGGAVKCAERLLHMCLNDMRFQVPEGRDYKVDGPIRATITELAAVEADLG